MKTSFEKKLNYISNFIIKLIITLNFLILSYVIYKDKIFYNDNEAFVNYYDAYYKIIIISIIVWLIILYFGKSLKPLIIISSFSLIIGLYCVEIFLFSNIFQENKNKKRINYDTRVTSEILEEYKDYDPVSQLPPSHYLKYKHKNKNTIFPVGGISNKLTVFCNESGKWSIYRSDRHGFNNPDYVWDYESIDIIFSGDSFAHGACVDPDNDIGENLRKLGKNTINLAYSGNGPLIQHASIIEFTKKYKPKIVLWFFYEGNDLSDLATSYSYEENIFKKYLSKNFSQNLANRQSEVDEVLKTFFKNEYMERIIYFDKKQKKLEEKGITNADDLWDYKKSLKLYKIREFFKLAKFSYPQSDYDRLQKILKIHKEYLDSNKIDLYFVYLPRFSYTIKYTDAFEKNKIIKLVQDLNINIIDIDKLVFKKHKDPLSLFPYRKKNHYNEEGYKLISEEISYYLDSPR